MIVSMLASESAATRSAAVATVGLDDICYAWGGLVVEKL